MVEEEREENGKGEDGRGMVREKRGEEGRLDPSNCGLWIRQWRKGGKGEGREGSLDWGIQALLFFHFKH